MLTSPAPGRTTGDGGHTSVEVLAWTSTLIAGITILVQALAAGLGTLACQAAAHHSLQTTRVAGGRPESGLTDARTVLRQASGRLVTNPAVSVTRTAGASSTVTVSGTALAIIPTIRIPVSATVSGPTEPDLTRP